MVFGAFDTKLDVIFRYSNCGINTSIQFMHKNIKTKCAYIKRKFLFYMLPCLHVTLRVFYVFQRQWSME